VCGREIGVSLILIASGSRLNFPDILFRSD
jgi:hypothetical protein